MAEPTLFDLDPARAADEPELSAGRRRTIRQRQVMDGGLHPLSLLRGGTTLRLHPSAPPVDDRQASGPRCGSCAFVEQNGWDYFKCTAGRSGEIGTPTFRRGPFETHGAATDLRAWWPGCERWEQRDE